MTARDASLRNWFAGNEARFEKQLTVDITPPTLELIADDRYVNFGGVGAIVYKASADTATSGVRMGEHFFPGFAGQIKGQPDHYFALFAHPYDAPRGSAALARRHRQGRQHARDALAYELKNVKYRKSTIALSDSFLQNKVAPLLTDVAARQGAPKDVFVAVNKTLRKENDDKIAEITEQGHAGDAVEGRLRAAQQLEGRGQLRRPAHLHLQRRGDRHRLPPRLRPLGHQQLPGRGGQRRHGRLRRATWASTATP